MSRQTKKQLRVLRRILANKRVLATREALKRRGLSRGIWDKSPISLGLHFGLSLIHISEPTRQRCVSRMPSSA